MKEKTKLEAALDELLSGKSAEEIVGPEGLLKQLTKAVLERAMGAELTHHLGYEKGEASGRGSGNNRNGQSRKKVQGDFGSIEVATPRDRNGSFELKILPKHERRFAGFDQKILSMYARGMSTRDIQGHLEEIYAVEVSPSLISEVTEAVMEDVRAWQSRPLDPVYPIVYLDALIVKMRQEGRASLSAPKIQQVIALTGRTVLLPSDDVAAYRQHLQDFTAEFQPVGPRESELVQALADHSWRLSRIATLEMAIYAYGHEQFAEQFADRGELQAGFTQMHTFLHYEKQLRNLQIQESRIRRNREKDTAELLRLQQERADQQRDKKPDPIPIQAMAGQPTPLETQTAAGARAVGFDFSFPNEFAETAACFLTDQLSHRTGPSA